MSRDEMFKQLSKLHWRDKDELKMTRSALTRLPRKKEELRTLFNTMLNYASELSQIINAKITLPNLTHEEEYDFLFHILAKGEEFYNAVKQDPDMCLYLIEQCQQLYMFLKAEVSDN